MNHEHGQFLGNFKLCGILNPVDSKELVVFYKGAIHVFVLGDSEMTVTRLAIRSTLTQCGAWS